MIVYDLTCSKAHRFEGWFASSDDYAEQTGRGLLTCPACGCGAVSKAPMAPSVRAKKGGELSPVPDQKKQSVANTPLPTEVAKAFRALAEAQAKALESSTWVGDKFAEQARSMHYGESDEKPIHGKATKSEARDLVEEGIKVAPLLLPAAPPDKLN